MGSVNVDLSPLKKLKDQLKQADGTSLQTGWFESARYEDGTPVAGIAAQNEFGNPKISIPARPFLRPTVDNQKGDWAQLMDSAAAQILAGNISMKDALNGLGLKSVADIKNSITTGGFPALSPITIALRKLRNQNVPIGGKTVGWVAAAIAEGKTAPGELGDQSFGNQDPLRETGYMISTLTYEVA